MTSDGFGYSSLVSESIRLAWKQRSLWVLGFLLGGTGGAQITDVLDTEDFVTDELGIALFLVLLLVAFVLGIIFFVLSSIAEAGLVGAGEKLATGRNAGLGESWTVGTRHWLRMIGLTLLLLFIMLPVSLALLGLPVLLGVNVHPLVGVLTGFVTVAIWVALFVFLVPWFAYARRHIVLAPAGIGESLGHSTDIIRRDPLRTFGVSLVRFVFIIATVVPLMIVSAIVVAPVVALYLASEPVGILAAIFFAFPILAVLGSFVNTMGSYFWTLAYMWLERDLAPAVADEPPITDSGI